ncbi:MAG: CotH kinase family protein, partial [Dysgonamonadaceae bacterium]|nr:CotH kinase family protein [Dysgonamonadaceae bacterium]
MKFTFCITGAILYVLNALSPLYAQDLAGYQKLRGAVLSTMPDDDYTRHAYNAFDTNKSTNFMAKDVDGWVGLDLGASYTIRKIRVYPMPDRHGQFEGAKFQGADNPEFNNVVTLLTVNQGLAPNEYKVYDIQNSQAFRYVRCMNPDHRVSLAELEFYTDENAQSANYLQLTNLPTVYLETNGSFDFVNKSTWAVGKVAVANSGLAQVFDAQIRGRGNSSWDFMEKKSFRIKFDKKQNFLRLPAKAKNWTLIAVAVDKTLLRNGLAFEISQKLGFEFTPSCKMVDVVLDGFYYGTYMASDHIDVNENRINIDEMTPDDITTPNLTGGYHLEIDAYADLEPSYFYSPRGIPFTIKSPDSDEILPVQKSWIENHIATIENTLFDHTGQALQDYIDIESAVKYYIHSELTGNCDSYWCIPCYKKRNDDKLYFGPVWDYDQAFLTNYRVPLFTETLSTQHGVAQSWFRRIMQQP